MAAVAINTGIIQTGMDVKKNADDSNEFCVLVRIYLNALFQLSKQTLGTKIKARIRTPYLSADLAWVDFESIKVICMRLIK